MKFHVVQAAFFCLFLFFSCASHDEHENSFDATLKSSATRLDSSTEWAESAEDEKFSARLSSAVGISKKIASSPEIFPLSVAYAGGKKIFPKISGAWSLDVSLFPGRCYDTVDDFMNAFEMGGNMESFFEPSELFSLVMFMYDFTRLYGDMKAAGHAIGEPFLGDGYIQCPARIFLKKKAEANVPSGEKENESKIVNYDGVHADAMIFVRNSESGSKIISIDLICPAGE